MGRALLYRYASVCPVMGDRTHRTLINARDLGLTSDKIKGKPRTLGPAACHLVAIVCPPRPPRPSPHTPHTPQLIQTHTWHIYLWHTQGIRWLHCRRDGNIMKNRRNLPIHTLAAMALSSTNIFLLNMYDVYMLSLSHSRFK